MNIFNKTKSEKVIYSDFDINFIPDWNRDITSKTNARAVSQSLINIITTKKGSMPFDRHYGTTVNSEMFRNITPFIISTTVDDIMLTVRRYEPRVDYLNIEMSPVSSVQNKNTLELVITFSTKWDVNTKETLSFELSESE